MTANASARPHKCFLSGLEFPGFISYESNDNNIDLSGLVYNTGTIIIGKTPQNPQSIDDRENRTLFCYGNTILIQALDKTGNWQTHPRGYLRLLKSFYNPAEQKVSIDVGCTLSLFKDRADDYLTDAQKEALKNPNIAIDAVISELLTAAGITSFDISAISGTVIEPVNVSGSLIDLAGSLAIRADRPCYLTTLRDGSVKAFELQFIDSPPALSIAIGLNEISYSPIDNGVANLSELKVIGRQRVPAEPELEEGEEEEETEEGKSRRTLEEEFGPAAVVDAELGLDEILLAQTETVETINPIERKTTITTTQRKGITFPASTTGRAAMLTASKIVKRQLFDATGRLDREIEEAEQCYGQVYSAWLGKHSNWVVNDSGVGQTHADKLQEDTTLVFSYKKTKRYFYNAKDVVIRTYELIEKPVTVILPDIIPFINETAPAESTEETWRIWGRDEYHKTTKREPFAVKYPDAIAAMEALRETNVLTQIQVSVFRRDGGTTTYQVRYFPTPLIEWEIQSALSAGESTLEISRSGLTHPPATEYMPNKNSEDGNSVEDFEDKELTVLKIFQDDCPIKAPVEVQDLGVVRSQEQLDLLAEILYFLRQGKSKGYELVMPFSDEFFSFENALPYISVVEPDGRNMKYVATGLTYTVTPDSSLVLADCLWIGESATAPATLGSTGGVSVPAASTSKYNLGDVVSFAGTATTASSQQTYYVVGLTENAEDTEVILSDTPGGSPISFTQFLNATLINETPSRVKKAFPLTEAYIGGIVVGGFVQIFPFDPLNPPEVQLIGGIVFGGIEQDFIQAPGGIKLGGLVDTYVEDLAWSEVDSATWDNMSLATWKIIFED